MMMLLTSTLVFADDWKWDEKTRDAAYEAPNSKLQKKWYLNDEKKTTFQFGANGALKQTFMLVKDGIEYTVTITGKYTRNKDEMTISYPGIIKVVPSSSDLANLPVRKRDEVQNFTKQCESYLVSEFKNKTYYGLILRLDDECFIMTNYDPQTKIFNDVQWDTFYNEYHMKKEEERAAQLAVEKARQDSIRQVQEAEAKARREAEEKARREAEEKAKREAEERARLAEEARIKAENEYWARMGTEKKASADKAATEGVKLVDLGLSVRWADRNIGAANPKDGGGEFRWGEVTPCTYLDKYKPVMKPKKGAVLDAMSDPATVKWGVGFHVPTPEQWKELFEKCTFMLDEQNKTFIVTGPNGNQIIFPYDATYDASYWTNTISTEKKEAYMSCIKLRRDTKEIKKYLWEIETTYPYTVRAVME